MARTAPPPPHSAPPSSSKSAALPADASVAKPHRYLLGGVTLGAIVGLYVLTMSYAWWVPLVYDEAVYLQIAQKITHTGCPITADGGGTVFLDNPPLVTYAVALARKVGGDELRWLRSVHVTLWMLPAYLATCLLATRMFGPAAGLLALVALFTPPRFILESSEVKLDVPLASLTALFLLAVYQVHRATTRRAATAYAVLCAVVAGLACMTKHQGVLLPIIGVIYLLIIRLRAPRATRWQAPYPEAWTLAGALVGGAVWFAVGTTCGGNFLGAIRANLRRTTFQSNEPWFHQPLLVYWRALAVSDGAVLVASFFVSVVLWGKRWLTDARLLLLGLSAVVLFVFCSAIGLRNERYFLPAVPVLAILVGSLASPEAYAGLGFVRRRPRLNQMLPWAMFVVIVPASAFLSWQSINDLARLKRIGIRSNAYYLAIGHVVKEAIPEDERVLLSRVQTAYIAERNYFLSEYDVNGANLVALLANPANKIALVAMDSPQMLRGDMPAADQRKVWDYIRAHFVPLSNTGPASAVYRRVSW